MVSVFLKLLNMSLTASWIVLAVVAFRVLFPKAPKWINCLLWGIVGLRLLVPVALESSLSLIPSAEIFPQDIAVSATPAIDSGISVVNNTVNPLLTFQFLSDAAFMQKLLTAAAVVWLAGTALMLAYSAFTYLRLSWRVRASLRIQENIYVCDAVVSFAVRHMEDMTPAWKEYYLEALWREDNVCLPRGKKVSYVLFVCEKIL